MSYGSNYNLNQRVSYLEWEIDKIAPIPPTGYLTVDGSQVVGTGVKTFTNLPECNAVPNSNDQLVNKLYVDNLFPPVADTLSAVLTAGNTANNSIILTDGVDTTTINKTSITTTNLNGAISVNNTNANATHYFTFTDNHVTGNYNLQADTGLSCNPNANSITATTFIGALQGNADTATNATNASNTGTTLDATNATRYIEFKSATTGNLPDLVDADLTYNPSTNTLTAGTFSGALQGNADTATTATNANNVNIANDNTNATYYPVFSAGTGNQPLKVDNATTPWTINPNTGAFNFADTIIAGVGAGSTNSVLGKLAGTNNTGCVAIGDSARGANNGGANGTAVGRNAGYNGMGDRAVCIGGYAGQTLTGANDICIGWFAGGSFSVPANNIIIDAKGGANITASGGTDRLFIDPIRNATQTTTLGYDTTTKEITYYTASAGNATTINVTDSDTNATFYPTFVSSASGTQTLYADTTTTPWSINPNVGTFNFANTIVAGVGAGSTNSVLGKSAGTNNTGCVAIGDSARGANNGGSNSTCVGRNSGYNGAGDRTTLIGGYAGQVSTGSNTICLGYNAGGSFAVPANNIIIDANLGANITSSGGTNRLYIDPVRNANPNTLLGYNATSKEITYSSTIDGTIAFTNPPTCSTSASTTNQLTNWDNFSSWVSYTPTWTSDGGAGTPTYQYQTGYYCKIGKMVMFSVDIRTTDMGTLPAGVLRLTLPFQNNSLVSSSFAIGFFQFTANNLDVITFCEASATGTRFFYKTASASSYGNFVVADGNVANFTCRISGTYMSI